MVTQSLKKSNSEEEVMMVAVTREAGGGGGGGGGRWAGKTPHTSIISPMITFLPNSSTTTPTLER